MSRQKIIFSLIVVCSISVLASQNSSQKPKSEIPEYPNNFEDNRQNIPEEKRKEMEDWSAQQRTIFEEQMSRQMAEFERNRRDFERLRDLKPEQRIREMQRIAREQEERAMKQALGVDERQWKIIEPKIENVKACQERASVSIELPFSSSFVNRTSSPQGIGFGSGFQYQFGGSGNMSSDLSSFQNQFNRRQSEGQRICQELQVLLDNMNSSPEAIKQKVLELQRARARAKKQLAQARKELREVLTLRQQARLCLMGLLD